eukprot:291373-Pleurochrysis_carterae.AAC.6
MQIASSGEAAINNVAENVAIRRQDGRQLKSAVPTPIRRRHRTSRSCTAGAVVLLCFLSPTPIPVSIRLLRSTYSGLSARPGFWRFLVEGYA